MIFNEGAYLTFRAIFHLGHKRSFFLERASISYLMLSAKQGNYWYHLYHRCYDTVFD